VHALNEGEKVTISTANYPQNYGLNECREWVFTAQPGFKVRVNMKDFIVRENIKTFLN